MAETEIKKDTMENVEETGETMQEQAEQEPEAEVELSFPVQMSASLLYDYLIQASLFSENGISTQELMSYLHISRATLSNRLSSISEQGLLIKNASGNIRYYKLNLDEVEKLSSANTDEE